MPNDKVKRRVAIVMAMRDNEMCLIKRKDTNKFSCPGGHINEDETPEEGARRELIEETRLVIDGPLKLIDTRTIGNMTMYTFRCKVQGNPSNENDPDQEGEPGFYDVTNGIPVLMAPKLTGPKDYHENVVVEKLGLCKNAGTMTKSDEDLHLEKVALTPESTASSMRPHKPYPDEEYDKVETYDGGESPLNPGKRMFQHVYHSPPISDSYRSVLHVLSPDQNPLNSTVWASSASGLTSVHDKPSSGLPWQDGSFIQHGETASTAPGRGLGSLLYQNMAKIHGRMASDSSVSAGANGVWNKLLQTPGFHGKMAANPKDLHWVEHQGPQPKPLSVLEGDGRPLREMHLPNPYEVKLTHFPSKNANQLDYIESEAFHKPSGEKVGVRGLHIDHQNKRIYQQPRHLGGVNHFDPLHQSAGRVALKAVQDHTGYAYGGEPPSDLGKAEEDFSGDELEQALADINKPTAKPAPAKPKKTKAAKVAPGSEGPQDTLVGVHNLSPANLQHAHELGGNLIAPSLAVTHKDAPLEGFGDISLVAGHHLIDPAQTPVFNADIYSPRHPRSKQGIDEKKVHELQRWIKPHASAVGAYFGDIDNEIKDRGVQSAIVDNDHRAAALGHAFLTEKGVVPTPNMVEKKKRYEWAGHPIMQQFRATHGVYPDQGYDDPASQEYRAKFTEAARQAIPAHAREEVAQNSDPENTDTAEELTNSHLYNFFGSHHDQDEPTFNAFNNSHADMQSHGQLVPAPNHYKIHNQLRKHPEFKDWANKKLAGIETEKYLPKYRDTANGPVETKVPYTPENILKEMTRTIRNGEGFGYGMGNTRAKAAKQYKTMKEMQADRHNIMPEAEFNKHKEANDAKFDKITSDLNIPSDDVHEALGNSFKRGGNLAAEFAKMGYKNIPAQKLQQLKEFGEGLKTMPTHYFEAKPQRIVGLNEFHGAAVPHDIDPSVHETLKRYGINHIEPYDKEVPGARSAAIQRIANAKQLLLSEMPMTKAEDPWDEIAFGSKLQTGVPASVPYSHRRSAEKTSHYGARFGQDVEPHGQYMGYHSPNWPKMDDSMGNKNAYQNVGHEYGTVHFKNPIVAEGGNIDWKTNLSNLMGGRKNKALSTHLQKLGHDGVIARGSDGRIHEMVNLAGQKEVTKPLPDSLIPKLKKKEQDDEIDRALSNLNPAERSMALKLNGVHDKHLIRAFEDQDPKIQGAALHHPNLSTHGLLSLMQMPDRTDLQLKALEHPALNRSHLEALYHTHKERHVADSAPIIRALSHHNLLDAPLIEQMVKDGNGSHVVEHTATPPRIIAQIIEDHQKDPEDGAKKALARRAIKHAAAPANLIAESFKNGPADIKMAIAQSQHLPEDIAQDILQGGQLPSNDHEALLRATILQNPKATPNHIKTALRDRNTIVQQIAQKASPSDAAFTKSLQDFLAPLHKAVDPQDFADIISASDARGPKLIDHKPDLTAHPPDHDADVQAYKAAILDSKETLHPDNGKVGSGGVTKKAVYTVPNSHPTHAGARYLAKPYFEAVPKRMSTWHVHPGAGWSESTNQSLYHAGGIGHLHQKVHTAEHNLGPDRDSAPVTVIKLDPDMQEPSNLQARDMPHPLKREARKVAMMDFLSGALDRHWGNVLVGGNVPNPAKPGESVPSKLMAIDNGRNFQYMNNHEHKWSPRRNQPDQLEDKFAHYVGPHTALSDMVPVGLKHDVTSKNPNQWEKDWTPTFDWWKSASPNVREAMNKRLEQIKVPELKEHIARNFNERANWLDERAHAGINNYTSDWHQAPVKQFRPGEKSDREIEHEHWKKVI